MLILEDFLFFSLPVYGDFVDSMSSYKEIVHLRSASLSLAVKCLYLHTKLNLYSNVLSITGVMCVCAFEGGFWFSTSGIFFRLLVG